MTDMPEIPRWLVEVLSKVTDDFDPNALHCGPEEAATAYYTAVIRAMLERVTLKWRKLKTGAWLAGEYVIVPAGNGFSWYVDSFHCDDDAQEATTIEAAKSAALAHHRAAWLAAMGGKE